MRDIGPRPPCEYVSDLVYHESPVLMTYNGSMSTNTNIRTYAISHGPAARIV